MGELKWEKSNYPTGVYATPRLRGLYPRAVDQVLSTEEDAPLGFYELPSIVFDERVPKNEIWATDGKTVGKIKLWDWEGIE